MSFSRQVECTVRARATQHHLLRPVTWQYGNKHSAKVIISSDRRIAMISIRDRKKGLGHHGTLSLLEQDGKKEFTLNQIRNWNRWQCREGWLMRRNGLLRFELHTSFYNQDGDTTYAAWIDCWIETEKKK